MSCWTMRGARSAVDYATAKGVSDVVVTPQLKRWHALHALGVVYRDAFNNQLTTGTKPNALNIRSFPEMRRSALIALGSGW